MIFDNRPITEITESELTGLIGNQEENQWIDFKRKEYHKDPKKPDKHQREICKDITAMANADGGYILIGVSEKNKLATGFCNVSEADKVAQSINGICLQSIKPRIWDLEVEPKSFQWDSKDITLVIVRIPASGTRPHGFLWKGSTNFVKRYGAHTREYPMDELRQDLLKLHYPPIIGQVDGKLDTILRNMGADKRSSMSPQDDALEQEDVRDLLHLMKLRFQAATLGKPYYRIFAVPTTLNPDAVPIQEQHIRDILLNPPDRRYGNFGVTGIMPRELSRFPEGIRGSNTTDGEITLLKNGFLEVRCPLSGSQFQWRRTESGISEEWLYPYVVCEFPVTFLRLVKKIYTESGIDSKIFIQQEYHNLNGFILIGGRPDSAFVGARRVFEHSDPIISKPSPTPVDLDFSPDRVSYDLVKDVYDYFELDETYIPAFDEEGNFILK